jgi:hypothetical protein
VLLDSPATIRAFSFILIVMAWHGPIYAVRQVLCRQKLWLTGDVAIAWHVAHSVVLLVVVDLLWQWTECGDIRVRLLIYHSHLKFEFLNYFIYVKGSFSVTVGNVKNE